MDEKEKLREQIRSDAEKARVLEEQLQNEQIKILLELLHKANTAENTYIRLFLEAAEYTDEFCITGGRVCRVDLGSPDADLRSALITSLSERLNSF